MKRLRGNSLAVAAERGEACDEDAGEEAGKIAVRVEVRVEDGHLCAGRPRSEGGKQSGQPATPRIVRAACSTPWCRICEVGRTAPSRTAGLPSVAVRISKECWRPQGSVGGRDRDQSVGVPAQDRGQLVACHLGNPVREFAAARGQVGGAADESGRGAATPAGTGSLPSCRLASARRRRHESLFASQSRSRRYRRQRDGICQGARVAGSSSPREVTPSLG
jgi:hypothetical protein